MFGIEDLRGLWRRTLIKRRWRRADCSTIVYWLQGPRFFVDLRQPPKRPDFAGVQCLRQLQPAHLAWMARQEGFAGHLELNGHVAEWGRGIDFQPGDGSADRARLTLNGDMLREDGTEAPYYEEWVREGDGNARCWGLKLTGEDEARSGYLVRVGSRFMYARERAFVLPKPADLNAALTAAPDLAARQDLVNFEISLGEIDSGFGTWRIVRSSLPFKEGGRFEADCDPTALGVLRVGDVDAEGEPVTHLWRILAADDSSYLDGIPCPLRRGAEADRDALSGLRAAS